MRVAQYDDDMNLIATYPSQSAAAKATGIWQATISAAIGGRLKKGGGYIWRSICVARDVALECVKL